MSDSGRKWNAVFLSYTSFMRHFSSSIHVPSSPPHFPMAPTTSRFGVKTVSRSLMHRADSPWSLLKNPYMDEGKRKRIGDRWLMLLF